MANMYFLKQLMKGCSVQMYEAEIEEIKKYIKKENPELIHRVRAIKQSDSKYLLCRIV